ncbi:MAG: TusE/DsrC/DsvC family sulfur relay protein [Alphaproteobacteria bacterium]|nr:TusE/DsrC/DsvC family sulfur relay protein [Alphaproteobacteria bacterium]
MSTDTLDLEDLLDEDGLVKDFSFWSEGLARDLARSEGIQHLSDRHWHLIRIMRSEYDRMSGPPAMRSVCRSAGIDRGDVNDLFGYCLVAWKVAGLPNPGQDGRTHLGSM